MNDLLLIARVQQHEELYNGSHKKYADNNYKDMLWAKIGNELHCTGSECKMRWFSLRDQLRKSLRIKLIKNDQGVLRHKTWRYEERMRFILPFLKERKCHNTSQRSDAMVSYGELLSQVGIQPQPQLPAGECNSYDDSKRQKTAHIITSTLPTSIPMLKAEAIRQPQYFAHPTASALSGSEAIDAFFQGLAATVKQFNPYYQNLAKSKLFNVISELELEQIQNHNF